MSIFAGRSDLKINKSLKINPCLPSEFSITAVGDEKGQRERERETETRVSAGILLGRTGTSLESHLILKGSLLIPSH